MSLDEPKPSERAGPLEIGVAYDDDAPTALLGDDADLEDLKALREEHAETWSIKRTSIAAEAPQDVLWFTALAQTMSYFPTLAAQFVGTGFHVGGGVFVTAGHNLIKHEGGRIHRCESFNANINGVWCEVIEARVRAPYDQVKSPNNDIAFFRLKRAEDAPEVGLSPVFVAPQPPNVSVAGFDAGRVLVALKARASPTPSGRFTYMGKAVKGMSGGPVFDAARLRVFGAHVSQIENTTTCFAVPLTRPFLREAGWVG